MNTATATAPISFADIDFENNMENKLAFESFVTLWWNLCIVRGINCFAYAELEFNDDHITENVICRLKPIRHNNVIAKESVNHDAPSGFGHFIADPRARNLTGTTIAELVRNFFVSRMCTKITPEMFLVYVTLLREEFDVITIQNGHAFKDMNSLFDFTGKVGDEWCRMGCAYGSCNDITDNVAHGYGQIDFNGFWMFGASEAVVHETHVNTNKKDA
jgi:hypothetical protein